MIASSCRIAIFCFILFISFFHNEIIAGAPKDSLWIQVRKGIKDTSSINAVFKLGNLLIADGKYTTVDSLVNSAIPVAAKQLNMSFLSRCYTMLGTTAYYQGNYPEAFKQFSESLAIQIKAGNKKGMAESYTQLGAVSSARGNYPEAHKNFFQSLKIAQEVGNQRNIAINYNNIGLVYQYQGDYDQAIRYYNLCLDMNRQMKNDKGLAYAFNNIGLVYLDKGNYEKSLGYFIESIRLKELEGDKVGIGLSYHNVGNAYQMMARTASPVLGKKFQDSSAYYFKLAVDLRTELNDQDGLSATLVNISALNMDMRDYVMARANINKALQMALAVGSKLVVKSCYEYLSKVDSATGNGKQALENYKLSVMYNDSLVSEENNRKSVEAEMQFEFDKKESIHMAEQLKNEALAKEELESQQFQYKALSAGAGLLIILAGLIFNGYLTKKKSNLLLSHQNEIIREKNKEITDSINYAARIQRILLTSEGYIRNHIKAEDLFILYKPKDIVSGDFYFAVEYNGHFYLIVADCTGHGVPGAFMSMLCISFLNEVIIERGITSPDQILNEVRSEIIAALNRDIAGNDSSGIKDGMDCVLICFNDSMTEISYACANNAFYIVRNGELHIMKGDKMPVGQQDENPSPFTLKKFPIQKGDLIFGLTDGYPDQFGGPKGKKFKYKQLEDLLSSSGYDCEKIKYRLDQEITSWMGGYEQVDDILIIGVKV